MRAFRVIMIAMMGCSIACPALGGVFKFVPGDAFFSSDASDETITYDPEVETLRLTYTRYTSWSMFCGSYGQDTLVLKGIPSPAMDAVEAVKKTLIADAPPPPEAESEPSEGIFGPDADDAESEEAELEPYEPGVVLWVYPRDFEVTRFRLGLKYNERWPAMQRAAGAHFSIYDAFHDDLVVTDWTDAEDVAAFEVKLEPRDLDPEEAEAFDRRKQRIEEKLASSSEEVREKGALLQAHFKQQTMLATRLWNESQIVMMLGSQMDAVMERKPGAEFYVISDRIRLYRVTENEKAQKKITLVDEKPLVEEAA